MNNRVISKLIILTFSLLFLTSIVNTAYAKTHQLIGVSSYYSHKHHGKLTASGDTFNMYANTAAHKTLPLGGIVKVTNLRNGKSVIVKINDRGPYVKGRILDVSLGVARKLKMVKKGITKVKIEVISIPKKFKYNHANAKRYLNKRKQK